jgi:hypothetical protein
MEVEGDKKGQKSPHGPGSVEGIEGPQSKYTNVHAESKLKGN